MPVASQQMVNGIIRACNGQEPEVAIDGLCNALGFMLAGHKHWDQQLDIQGVANKISDHFNRYSKAMMLVGK